VAHIEGAADHHICMDNNAAYLAEAKARWGSASVEESDRRMRSWSDEKKRFFLDRGEHVVGEIAAHMHEGVDAEPVRKALDDYLEHLNHFFDCTPDIFVGLGRLYSEDERFAVYFRRFHPELPGFLRLAMAAFGHRQSKPGPAAGEPPSC